jgi:uncharacterized protein
MAGMFLERAAAKRLQGLMESFPAVVVAGARQVGKSTLLEHALKERAEFVVFDPVIDVENARRDPELFLDSHSTPIVLDEIQYAPELLGPIKRRIDMNRKPGQYILSGSQQWGVMKSVAESLAGRVAFLDMEGLSLAEAGGLPLAAPWLAAWLDDTESVTGGGLDRLEAQFSIYERLWRGFLPDAQFMRLEAISDFHTAYQRTYIERDARLMADISDWQLFGRFMRLAAALTAQQINHSQLGRELGMSPHTASHWLSILSATYQWFEVPAYSGNTVKRVSGKPKGYIADTGVACAAAAISTPRAIASHPSWGALFETAVFAEVRKAVVLMSPRPNIYHWRSHGGAEVDLLLERDGRFYPLEIKAKSRPNSEDTSGITAFRATYPHLRVEQGLVLAPTEKPIRLSANDYAIPWDAILPGR